MSQNSAPLKAYTVTHRPTGERKTAIACNPEEACTQCYWDINECLCEEQPHSERFIHNLGFQPLCKIPIRVCPYQYAQCALPTNVVCPNRPANPDVTAWVIEATQSHLCDFIGTELSKKEWTGYYRWVTIAEALTLLTRPQP